eukprot:CAMPEP_0113941668 /NCGR_PEP_ID=MMETSP1339-20121228/7540_1 /TAXON_ID=94617 /ORGANISM="Fibrocapsa japonica" /LENGTH=88 /DNA_ID=CAMNT_0000945875 /DNA_START=100 /DNA_END=362 /DNA_ORIENTATION=+ /assembly_acc=CAM_ASM_000762
MGDQSDEFRIFVGNLSWGTDDASLQKAGEFYGEVTRSKVVVDQATGRSKGFGFLSFSTKEAFNAALNGLNGMELDGRSIRTDHDQGRG